MSFINKNSICKEKSRALFWNFGISITCGEITHKIRTSFKTLASKQAATWSLIYSQNNDKFSWKVIYSSYHIE